MTADTFKKKWLKHIKQPNYSATKVKEFNQDWNKMLETYAKQDNHRLVKLIDYLYTCYVGPNDLVDHVEDEIKQIIESL